MPLAVLRRESGGATEEEVEVVAEAEAGGDSRANGGREMRQVSRRLWGGGDGAGSALVGAGPGEEVFPGRDGDQHL